MRQLFNLLHLKTTLNWIWTLIWFLLCITINQSKAISATNRAVIIFGNVIVMPSVDSDKGSDRFRKLYPLVDEEKTPLPHGWNPKDKGQFIGISQNGRRVSYRGGLLLFSLMFMFPVFLISKFIFRSRKDTQRCFRCSNWFSNTGCLRIILFWNSRNKQRTWWVICKDSINRRSIMLLFEF